MSLKYIIGKFVSTRMTIDGRYHYYPFPWFVIAITLKFFNVIESWWIVFSPYYPIVVMTLLLFIVGAKFKKNGE